MSTSRGARTRKTWLSIAAVCTFTMALAVVSIPGCEPGTAPEELAAQEAPVVYGTDDRDDVYAHPTALWRNIALQSTVTLMNTSTLDTSNPYDVRFFADTLSQSWQLCSSERFGSQPTAGYCSGTLIGPDLVLTAGHCITRQSECDSTAFVFRYAMADATTLETVTVDDVFYCASIEAQTETSTLDYAILRLDRPATPRFVPAPVAKDPVAVPNGTELVMVGAPSGLPVKIEDGGKVRDSRSNYLDYFVATTDSFGGNSGSGVYNDGTDDLVGILVRGDTDYVYDYYGGCYRVNVCSETGCGGEDVTYAFRAVDAFCANAPTDPLCASGPYCGDGNCDADESTANCPSDCGSLCGDGACNGAEGTADCPADCGTACGDGVCNGSEGTADCADDCGSLCGDGVCNGSEDYAGCPADCPANYCGDGVCDGLNFGESCSTCASDCLCEGRNCSKVCCGDGVCSRDEGRKGLCPIDCGGGPMCGDGSCDQGEDSENCPADCGSTSVCGDGTCDADEDAATCPADCGSTSVCGDGTCDADEDAATCPADCGGTGGCGDGVCAGWAAGEDCTTCPIDCECGGRACSKVCCGDGVCSKDEARKGFCPGDCQ